MKGQARHELACASCGAPLHDLKMLRKDRDGPRELVPPSRVRMERAPNPVKPKKTRPPKPVKRKRRKGIMRKIFEEAFDVIEDILD